MTPPNYPGTSVPMPEQRTKAHSQSEVTPLSEQLMKRIREDLGNEVERIVDLEGALDENSLRIDKLESAMTDVASVARDMRDHLKRDAELRKLSDASRKIRNRNLSIAWGLVSALIVAAFGAWVQKAINSSKDDTVKQVTDKTAQQIASSQPSTETRVRESEEHGRQLEYERWQQWQLEHPLPIQKRAETLAGKPPSR